MVEESVDPTTAAVAVKKPTGSRCERTWIAIAMVLLSAVAIASIALTLVMDARKKRFSSYADPKDPYFYGLPVEEGPFEIDARNGTSSTEPYASVEELRADVERLLKSLANKYIVEEANEHYYDVLRRIGEEDHDRYYDFDDDYYASDREFYDYSIGRDMDDSENFQKESRVASNGDYIFVVVDDRIQVLDTEGSMLGNYSFTGEYDLYYNSNVKLMINPGGDRLIVVTRASGYDYNSNNKHILIDSDESTLVTVFDIQGSNLYTISQQPLIGDPAYGHIVGDSVHVVTATSLNLYDFVGGPIISRNSIKVDGGNVTNDMYLAAAKEAYEERLPQLVDRAIQEFIDGDRILLSRLLPRFEDMLGKDPGVYQIASFNAIDGDVEVQLERLIVLGTRYREYYRPFQQPIYASDEWLWFTDDVAKREPLYETIVTGIKLEGTSARVTALGSVPGFLMSPSSIQFVPNDNNNTEWIRLAVTMNTYDSLLWYYEYCSMNENWYMNGMRLEAPKFLDFPDEGLVGPDEDLDGTSNRVIVLKIAEVEQDSTTGRTATELLHLGSVDIGEQGEIFTSVRFFGDTAYALPLDRTDPLYALDMTNNLDPVIIGPVSGFSKFMHPITEDHSMYLSVEEDQSGFYGHLTVSIFDVATADDPQLIESLVIKNAEGFPDWQWEWEWKKFEYFEDAGILVIPAKNDYLEGFIDAEYLEGFIDAEYGESFAIFRIDPSGGTIKRGETISHTIKLDHSRYDGTRWTPSVIRIGDTLVTTRLHTVIGTDIRTLETQWRQKIPDYDRWEIIN